MVWFNDNRLVNSVFVFKKLPGFKRKYHPVSDLRSQYQDDRQLTLTFYTTRGPVFVRSMKISSFANSG